MAYFLFAEAISKGKPIKVFNHGKMRRDFTYVDDIVNGIINVMNAPAEPDKNWDATNPDPSRSTAPYRLYNIGNNNPVQLMDLINEIEKSIGKKAAIQFEEMQAGDVTETWANVDDLINNFNYKPSTSISEGLGKFSSWYTQYYNTSE
jgi:UDP-glucuronate 4-epimerase